LLLAALGTGEAVMGVETSEDPEEDTDEVPTGDKGRYSSAVCLLWVVLEMPPETETTL
jgi:hypothetical protein